MSPRLEDRIKELCAKAVTTPESSPELNEILKQLQSALHEHNERLRGMVANRDTHTERRSTTSEAIDRYAICGKPIMLEQAKVTEDRKLVHGKCYVGMIEGK
jgi:uncharacterized coiled-coil DUF342 family protein